MLRLARWMIGLFTLVAFLAWCGSSRWSLGWTLAAASDGSQAYLGLRSGRAQWFWGEEGTILAGHEPGWRLDRTPRRDWDWWFEFQTSGPMRLAQIPLWPVVVMGAAGWGLLFTRERYVSQRAGEP